MRRNNPIVLTIMIFMNVIPSLMLTAFFILGFVLHDNLFFFLMIVPILFLIILNVMYFAVGKPMFDRSFEYYEDRLREDTSNDGQSPFFEDSSTAISIKELDSDIRSDETKDWDMPIILVEVFTGNIANQKCAICKLSFDDTETVFQCKNCLSLFHKEHLKQWLVNNTSCPVCDTKLKI